MLRITVLCLLATTALASLLPILNKLDDRIVGGIDADPGEYPSQLSLQDPSSHDCGASILNANWALTAAHCVDGRDPGGIVLVSGTNTWNEGGTRHQAVRFIVHENYSPRDYWENDIAVIEVAEPFMYSDIVQPVVLPTQDQQTETGANATVIGWGRLSEGGPRADDLQEVTVNIYDQDTCVTIYQGVDASVYPTQICAGVPEGGVGPCNADSGGPLFVNGTVVGIVSWSAKECAAPGYPTIYTRVASYRDWITTNTGV